MDASATVLYESRDPSREQRLTLAVASALWVLVVWWLLFGRGIEILSGLLGFTRPAGVLVRRLSLAVALSIYYIRLLFTWFTFLERGISWREVFTVAPWLLCIFLLLAISGGTNTAPFGLGGSVGIILFAVGSWLNSWAEYQRHVWKQQHANRGQLYTRGLFRYTRHPNYLGDTISYLGLCFVCGTWVVFLLPVITCAGFVFVNIPALDKHLRGKYGQSFDDYARRTAKLIPFLY